MKSLGKRAKFKLALLSYIDENKGRVVDATEVFNALSKNGAPPRSWGSLRRWLNRLAVRQGRFFYCERRVHAPRAQQMGLFA